LTITSLEGGEGGEDEEGRRERVSGVGWTRSDWCSPRLGFCHLLVRLTEDERASGSKSTEFVQARLRCFSLNHDQDHSGTLPAHDYDEDHTIGYSLRCTTALVTRETTPSSTSLVDLLPPRPRPGYRTPSSTGAMRRRTHSTATRRRCLPRGLAR
jgi:hypothetical protein